MLTAGSPSTAASATTSERRSTANRADRIVSGTRVDITLRVAAVSDSGGAPASVSAQTERRQQRGQQAEMYTEYMRVAGARRIKLILSKEAMLQIGYGLQAPTILYGVVGNTYGE